MMYIDVSWFTHSQVRQLCSVLSVSKSLHVEHSLEIIVIFYVETICSTKTHDTVTNKRPCFRIVEHYCPPFINLMWPKNYAQYPLHPNIGIVLTLLCTFRLEYVAALAVACMSALVYQKSWCYCCCWLCLSVWQAVLWLLFGCLLFVTTFIFSLSVLLVNISVEYYTYSQCTVRPEKNTDVSSIPND